MQLVGKTIFVTGAASGLGKAVAEALQHERAQMMLFDREAERLQAVARQIGSAAAYRSGDICNEGDVEQAIAETVAGYGRIDAVVHCAGISSAMRVISRNGMHDLETWNRVIAVNLTGTFNLLRLAARSMAGNDPDPETGERGVIVNTASIAAFDGQVGQVAYAASKAAVVGLTLPAARDLAKHAIRCVAVAPGVFDTELLQQVPEKGVGALTRGLLFPERLGLPEEFARLCLDILRNPYLNATCIRLDGGTRLQ